MASIVQNIVGDNALQMGSEEFVRKLAWGNSWNSLRLGIYFIVNGSSNIAAPAQLAVGLCNGDVNTYQSPSCVGWCGCGYGYGGALWTFTANSYIIGNGGSSFCHGLSKINGVITTTSTGNNTNQYCRAAGFGQPDFAIVDIIRTSSSSYTVHGGMPSQITIPNNTRFFEFMRSMEDEVGNLFLNSYNTISGNVVMSGLTDTLDTLSIYWNKAVPTIEISAVCVLRFY